MQAKKDGYIMPVRPLTFSSQTESYRRRRRLHARPVGAGAGGVMPGVLAMAPLDFGGSVNPISTTGTYYAYHSTTSPPPRIFRPCDGPAV